MVTPQEVQAQYEKTKQKAKIDYVVFKADRPERRCETHTRADLNSYYEANKNNYMEPEKRNVALLVADQEKIGATINVPEAQLHQAYDSRRDQYRTPERVRVRHILLKTTDKPPAEVAKIKQKAEDLLKQIEGRRRFRRIGQEEFRRLCREGRGTGLGCPRTNREEF